MEKVCRSLGMQTSFFCTRNVFTSVGTTRGQGIIIRVVVVLVVVVKVNKAQIIMSLVMSVFEP